MSKKKTTEKPTYRVKDIHTSYLCKNEHVKIIRKYKTGICKVSSVEREYETEVHINCLELLTP